jgi:hypothetical protein
MEQMRICIRRLGFLVLLAALLAPATASARSGASAAQASWQLVDNPQSVCFRSSGVSTGYYAVWIRGTWTRPIDIGLDGLPAGATTWTNYAPIPPGSSSGVYSLASVAAQLPQGTPVGTFTARLWASDGRTRQSVPVTLRVVESKCRAY